MVMVIVSINETVEEVICNYFGFMKKLHESIWLPYIFTRKKRSKNATGGGTVEFI